MKTTPFIWKNGEFIAWENATTHVLTHALHYGTAVFEGVRAYNTVDGPAIFRAKEHYDRLTASAKILFLKPPYTANDMINATKELLKKNELKSCYIRPIYYCGYGEMGLNPLKNSLDAVIAAWEWGAYLGEESLEKGVRCKMSSWARLDSRILPPMAKSAANYLNSALAKVEAIQCGFDEAILLNVNGTVAEGPGENIFVIKDGKIFTPPNSDCALPGITSQSATKIAQDLGYSVERRSLIRDDLFTADEIFFTGTAVEITPVREIDGRVIGEGKRGPITENIQKIFFDAVNGRLPQYQNWLTPIA